MEDDLAAGAFAESIVFLRSFDDLSDPRQRGKVKYPLAETRLLCVLAVLAGADCSADIARFGERKRDLLRRFRSFADGTPSHDHLGDHPGFARRDRVPAPLRGLDGLVDGGGPGR